MEDLPVDEVTEKQHQEDEEAVEDLPMDKAAEEQLLVDEGAES